jgi:diaminohydroxyphosphoribosylaminopyrimidine deaminase/5-amino-6-(5-phosphoribosylamino)uracil reductase
MARLRAAGIEVQPGVLADEARWVSLGHILRVTERRPFVQIKMALGADGSVPRGVGGRPTWATGPEARALGHLLRAEADAILVGARTVADDDPDLTCRLPGLAARSPLRVVLSTNLDLPLTGKLFQTARSVPMLVLTGESADPRRRAALEALGVTVAGVAMDGSGVSVRAAAETLAERGITRLLVEGGPTLWRAIADAGLVDEVHLFMAGAEASGPEALAALNRVLPGARLRFADRRRIGDDQLIVYRRS